VRTLTWDRRQSDRIGWAGIGIGFGLAVVMAVYSTGVHHDDDLTHLLMARWAWTWPEYLLNDWGRPGFTVLFAPAAILGDLPARIFAALLTAATAALVFDIARRQRLPLAHWTPWLLWLQPMTFTLAYTWLTETVLAFYLALALWLLQQRRDLLSAAVISLAMITRHEGALFLAIWGLAVWREPRQVPWRAWLLLPWAPVAHNVLSWWFVGDAPFVARFLDAEPTEEYGSAGWLWMLMNWPLAAGLAPLLLMAAGIGRYARRDRIALVAVISLVAYVLAHSVIYRYGLFASGGYYRFLVPVGPLVALCAADGLAQLWRRRVRRGPLIAMAVLAALWWLAVLTEPHLLGGPELLGAHAVLIGLLVVLGLALVDAGRASRAVRSRVLGTLAVVTLIHIVIGVFLPPPHTQYAPLRLAPEAVTLRNMGDWLHANGYAERHILTAHTWAAYFADAPRSPEPVRTFARLEQLAPGDLFIWDAKYAGHPYHNVPLDAIAARADFAEIARAADHPQLGIYWRIFERIEPPTQPESNHE
jgi:glycerol uptake facilitator-like aquaporin